MTKNTGNQRRITLTSSPARNKERSIALSGLEIRRWRRSAKRKVFGASKFHTKLEN